jgi:hypothetical protein
MRSVAAIAAPQLLLFGRPSKLARGFGVSRTQRLGNVITDKSTPASSPHQVPMRRG